MEKSNTTHLSLLLTSSALRTFTDSFVTGLLFAYSNKVAGEGVAALTSSLTLLLIFIFSPMVGNLIDKRIFSPKISGACYMLTGLLMPLFLSNYNFIYVFYANLLFLVVFNIPASLYLSSWSSLVFKDKPATGYALLASINTFFGIFGTILGSFLVQNELFSFWIDFKFLSSILVGIFLIFTFKMVDSKIFESENKKISSVGSSKPLKETQIISQTNKGIYASALVNYRYFKGSILQKIARVNRYVLLFGFCIMFFSIARTFFLTNVAFTVFNIFDRNIFLYTIVINTAALTAFAFYPFNGMISDHFGSWKYYATGVLITPFYFISFLIFTNNILLIILWALPIGVITDVSQIGIISLLTKKEERNSAIGFITSSNALGSVIGAFLLSIAIGNHFLLDSLIIFTIILPFLLLGPLIVIKNKQLTIKTINSPHSTFTPN